MNCSKLHDSLHGLFSLVDSTEYQVAVKTAFQTEDWTPLLGVSSERDHALHHIAECSDCIDDLLSYLEIRDTVDYRKFPCLHLAYYSTKGDIQCIENDHGFFSIILHGKEADGIGIGFCPWCGVPLPTSHSEMTEAESIGLKLWQQKHIKR